MPIHPSITQGYDIGDTPTPSKGFDVTDTPTPCSATRPDDRATPIPLEEADMTETPAPNTAMKLSYEFAYNCKGLDVYRVSVDLPSGPQFVGIFRSKEVSV